MYSSLLTMHTVLNTKVYQNYEETQIEGKYNPSRLV